MNEESENRILPTTDRLKFLAEIERLYLEGWSNADMADALGSKPLIVARNLRELKKRWARAAARQKSVLSLTQCATVYREAMDGWRRSQQPKVTTTEQKDPEKESPKTTTRREEGPGDKTFLQAAVSALKALRQFTADRAEEPAQKREMTDREYVILMQFLTQEQVDRLDDEQLQRIREAMENLRAEVDASRREEESGQEEPAGLHPTHSPELPGELAPRAPGEDAGPSSDGPVPEADGFHASSTWQERAGEPPLPGLHAGPQPEPAADSGQPHP